ncbi:MAG: DUF1573 domain-containing protein [Planctomycetes bacterium]|jgi:hypothetical protein|nr:DUF1573 domain-containing protein [Planctomycetota bacterium]
MRALLLLLLITTSFTADLAFERETISLTPKAGSAREIVSFPFRNAGTQPLTIERVEVSCGCTTADLEKRTYDPGEKGDLAIIFDLNGLAGRQDKTIQVYHDRGPMVMLTISALLAEAPTVAPSFLTWKVGAAADEQVAVVTMPEGVQEFITEVTTSSKDVTATLYPRDNDYAIGVKPVSTATATNVMITVRTDLGRTVRIFASVAP